MKRIGLTQRVEVVTAYAERRDCLDQSWVKLLMTLGLMPIPLSNIHDPTQAEHYLQSMDLDGVILTGGNDLSWTKSPHAAIERDQFETKLIDYFIAENMPLLGVCRGMQMLNLYFGGQLLRVDGHVTASHQITLIDGGKHEVNSYHDWAISTAKLAEQLTALGHSEDGLVEYCEHKTLPITAMMWHPERTNIDAAIGQDIIKETFL